MSLTGLDISTYQTTTPPLGGFAFVFARATYDVFADARYAQHMAAAKAAGIVRGAYHFGTGRSPADKQVAAFLAAAGDAQLFALDLEQDAVPMSLSQASSFIDGVQAQGHKIGLYHSESGFPSLGQDYDWVAHWGVPAPSRAWEFHQYTSDGTVPGYTGRLDLDRFNGSQADLNALAGIVPTPAPTPSAYILTVDKGATVHYSKFTTTGRYKVPDLTSKVYGRFACSKPAQKLTTHGDTITVVRVSSGHYGAWWVHLGPGVTAAPR